MPSKASHKGPHRQHGQPPRTRPGADSVAKALSRALAPGDRGGWFVFWAFVTGAFVAGFLIGRLTAA
jgi:hypothetical protein